MEISATNGVNAQTGKVTAALDGDQAEVSAGGSGLAGSLALADAAGTERVIIRAGVNPTKFAPTAGAPVVFPANITIDGDACEIQLGTESKPGRFYIPGDVPGTQAYAVELTSSGTLGLAGGNGRQRLVADGALGRLTLRGEGTADTVVLDGNATMTLGTLGALGPLSPLGLVGTPGLINVAGKNGTPSIIIRGSDGDIILENGDCAEEFDVASELIEPGTVMVIGANGTFCPSSARYDKKVAGVIAGAGDCKPGIRLGHRRSATPRKPVALTGKVYCKVDADSGAIEVGDLLTTSDTLGHAMKATEPSRAFGAVIGKALEPLASGRGLIPILVALQ